MRTLTIALASISLLACQSEDAVDDVNRTGGVAEEGGGNPYDNANPGLYEYVDPGKADTPGYTVPTLLPRLADPRVVVSLAGFSVELIDDETGFHKVYPTGVGALGSSGKSFTPVGEFKTGGDPDENWWYYSRRYRPEYFGGFPFLRLTAENSRGQNTYGFHGPITAELRRGYVSHGCMRMRGDDIVEMFTILKLHPSTLVSIQAEKRFYEDGELVDVTPPELDPVLAYRAMVDACKDAELDSGRDPMEALEPGSYEGYGLCGGDDHFFVKVAEGDLVRVQVSSQDGPVGLVLRQDDAIESGEATKLEEAPEDGDPESEDPESDPDAQPEESDEPWVTEVTLRAGAEGVVELDVLGDLVAYDLQVEVEPFLGE